MSRKLACVGLGLALAATPPDAFALSSAARDRVPGEIVVLLPATEVAPRATAAHPRLDAAGRARVESALAARGLGLARWLGPDGHALLARAEGAPTDADLDAQARALVASGFARAAAPNQLLHPQLTTPNDPYLATQWHLGTTAAGIRAQNAWDIATGSPSVVIGFIDTGVDKGHPDLAARIYLNPLENPANGIDDDGNGYVDDASGWDFADHDNDANPQFAVDSTVGIDVGFHGTFAAGLAAAQGNNALGITGVAWNCRILPLKVSNATSGITLAAVTEAFAYACDNGVSVLNLSFGGTDPSLQGIFQALVDDAVNADIVVVAAAGNAGTDIGTYPAACESVLAVAATDNANHRASFSNWGWYVDIAAPGASMWSSIARNYTRDATNDFIFSFLYGWDGVNPYMYNDGTSFACPLVSGAVALVRGKYPGVPPRMIIDHMKATADVVAYDNPIGGRLNVYNALLTVVDAGDAPAVGGVRLSGAVPNPLRGAATTAVSFTLPRAADVQLAVYDLRGRRVAPLVSGRSDAGTHRATWDGRDDSGHRVPAGLYFIAGRLDGQSRSTRVTVLR